MSGLEILQAVTASLKAVEVIKDALKFIENAVHAERHVQDLLGKVRDFWAKVEIVEALVQHRENKYKSGSASSIEHMIWKHLNASLRASTKLLIRFGRVVRRIKSHKPGPVQNVITELRLNWNREEIESFQRDLDAHLQAMQLWIMSLQYLSAGENHTEVMQYLTSIRGMVMDGRRQLTGRQGVDRQQSISTLGSIGDFTPTDNFTSRDSSVDTIAQYVFVGEELLNKLHYDDKLPDTFGNIEAFNGGDRDYKPRSEGHRGSVDQPAIGPLDSPQHNGHVKSPLFSPPAGIVWDTPLDVLEDLIETESNAVNDYATKSDNESALERHVRMMKLLEERQDKHGKDFTDRDKMLETKASFLIQLGRFHEAAEIFQSLISSTSSHVHGDVQGPMKPVYLKNARYSYLLGTVCLASYKSTRDDASLNVAKEYAEYAFNIQWSLYKSNSTAEEVVQSVKLVIEIHEARNDTIMANHYRRYLPQPQIVCQPPNCPSDPSTPRNSSSRRGSSSTEFTILNDYESDGRTALIKYICNKNASAVSNCLHTGADVNLKCRSGTPPIVYAAESGEDVIIKMLIESGAQINDSSRRGCTALHIAVMRNKLEAVRLIADHGPNMDPVDRRGRTPLMLATQKGNVPMVKILTGYKADVQAQTNEGWSALHYAVVSDSTGLIQHLCGAGANINAQCTAGKTPLHYACETGKDTHADELIKCGADITTLDEGGRSPLCLAVDEGQDKLVSLLLKAGAKPDKSVDGRIWKKYQREYENPDAPRSAAARGRLNSISTTASRESTTSRFSIFSRRTALKSRR
ncbi:hypothetical protein AJ80_01268 [Polytolypa hystricis UAMH7299]|uniref:Uncharacterized protein n=1 Tax=Polytolypa hystricis (strain UAMH7299) TaxID=1447883 RepID=A0A2B7Z1X9_POLH7|nr:hypothetical protein AJ80_01268 [Polytolypa hystricis UAMH7299]